MTVSKEEIETIKDELKWVDLTEYGDKKTKSKGILGFLVPVGCLITAGILATGINYLRKGDSRAQQKMMRYRVVSQGVTAVLATLGIIQLGKS